MDESFSLIVFLRVFDFLHVELTYARDVVSFVNNSGSLSLSF